ncbi:MAG: LIC_10190 family membrane protein, partial [Chitinophagaceae bacterium]
MLSLFFFHIIITGLCFCAGFIFYEIIPHRKIENFQDRPLIFYLLSGLILLTLFSQIIVVFLPLNILTQGILFFLLFITLFFKKKAFIPFVTHFLSKVKKHSALLLLTICCLWFLLLFLNAGKTMMDDTESYHIQMIKWIKQYGSVPGIVHLHERFGFNSSWFTSIAMFIPGSGKLNFYTSLNGVLSLWFSMYILKLIIYVRASGNFLTLAAVAVFAICFVSWPLLRGNVSTSNYDFITLLIIFVLFIETGKCEGTIKNFPLFPEWIIWPAYLFTVRITNFPIMFLGAVAFIILLQQSKKTNLF